MSLPSSNSPQTPQQFRAALKEVLLDAAWRRKAVTEMGGNVTTETAFMLALCDALDELAAKAARTELKGPRNGHDTESIIGSLEHLERLSRQGRDPPELLQGLREALGLAQTMADHIAEIQQPTFKMMAAGEVCIPGKAGLDLHKLGELHTWSLYPHECTELAVAVWHAMAQAIGECKPSEDLIVVRAIRTEHA